MTTNSLAAKAGFAFILLLYLVFVAALTIARVTYQAGEDEIDVTSIAVGVILLFTTIGPALLIAAARRRLAPVVPLARQRRHCKSRLRVQRKLVLEAQQQRQAIEGAHARWVEQAEPLRAKYLMAHRNAENNGNNS